MISRTCTALAALALVASTAPAAMADDSYTYAVIGDVPYGADQVELMDGWIADLNADESLEAVVHVGDTKSGGDVCSDDWNTMILDYFNDVQMPLVYTPGDNEWTDCHRESNGSYNPLERLDAIRDTYFPVRNETLGAEPMSVHSQPMMRENVRYHRGNVAFATAHIVGSNNGALPWSGLSETSETPAQRAERLRRTAAARVWITQTFNEARVFDRDAVVLHIHADMFYQQGPDGPDSPSEKYASEFAPLVKTLVREANRFGKPVYVINGDSHYYLAEQPLADGSVWLDFYGVDAAPNVTRIMVDGSSNANNYLRVTTTGDEAAPIVWERVPFNS